MSAHTKGPWEARTFMVMGGDGLRDRICHVGTSTSLGPPRSHESFANTRLIAAAPDLLEAAQLVVGSLLWNQLDPVSMEVMRRLRAAIAKAEHARKEAGL